MRPWRAIVFACLVAAGGCHRTEETRVDLLAVLDPGLVEPVTTAVEVGEPGAAQLLGDGWAAPIRLDDGTTGRALAARTATVTLFAGPRPIDAELRLERG